MVEPSPAEDLVGSLTKSLETACNNRDVIGFLGHFTPQQRAKIRRRIENQFICHDIEMEVQDTLLVLQSDTTIGRASVPAVGAVAHDFRTAGRAG